MSELLLITSPDQADHLRPANSQNSPYIKAIKFHPLLAIEEDYIGMFHVLSLLLLWCSLLPSTYSSVATPANFTFFEGSAGPAIINYLGGVEQFKLEVREAMSYATAWRNNTPAHCSLYTAGANGLVAKFCFEDGMCWADKMFTGAGQRQAASYGVGAMGLVHEYCPNILLPRSRAWFMLRVAHHMTEWIEGKSLFQRVFQAGSGCYTQKQQPSVFRVNS
jgi:hypothetical protein